VEIVHVHPSFVGFPAVTGLADGDCDACALLRDPFIHCVGEREVGGANMRACSRIPLFKINSAGVTPVEVFSTVFIIRRTMGSCSYDHLS